MPPDFTQRAYDDDCCRSIGCRGRRRGVHPDSAEAFIHELGETPLPPRALHAWIEAPLMAIAEFAISLDMRSRRACMPSLLAGPPAQCFRALVEPGEFSRADRGSSSDQSFERDEVRSVGLILVCQVPCAPTAPS